MKILMAFLIALATVLVLEVIYGLTGLRSEFITGWIAATNYILYYYWDKIGGKK